MKRYIIILTLLLFLNDTEAQDFTFSQFYETPLLRNPALAGIFNGNIRVQSAFRNQWASVSVPYQTTALSTEVTFPLGLGDDLLTVGMQVTNDVAGDSRLARTQLLPVVSFHKALNDNTSFLTLAFMGGYIQSQFDFSKLLFNDQFIDGMGPNGPTGASFDRTSFSYLDASTGLAFNSELGYSGSRFYLGVAAYHFLRSKVYFFDDKADILQPRFIANGGLNLVTGLRHNTYFYGDYIIQGGHRQFLAGILYNYVVKEYQDNKGNVSMAAGASYRWGDAVIPTFKMEFEHLTFGASYDINISKLKSASQYRGGLELTLSYMNTLNALLSRKVNEKFACPIRF
jgi:type IX secretion system PorP/SprF family membrane protein